MSENRRERFRRILTALSLAPPAGGDGSADIFVKRPDLAAAERVAARFEIDPSSSHLLVGGIGCGKTTQLYMIERHLHAVGDIRPTYVDVGVYHDLRAFGPGILFATAGVAIATQVERAAKPHGGVAAAIEAFTDWAYGKEVTRDFALAPPRPDVSEWEPGILTPPTNVGGDFAHMISPLRLLVQAVAHDLPHAVMLFDSLDRLTGNQDFLSLIQADIDAFASANVGVVVVAPVSVMFGASRVSLDRFSTAHRVPAVDSRSFDGHSFLTEVLRRRLPDSVLPSLVSDRIVAASGGVLRDLLSLTFNAVQNAYVSGKDAVEYDHVDAATEALGLQLLGGLNDDGIRILQRAQSSSSFTPVSQAEIDLVAFRLIVEYIDNGRSRYVVHPVIEPLLTRLSLPK